MSLFPSMNYTLYPLHLSSDFTSISCLSALYNTHARTHTYSLSPTPSGQYASPLLFLTRNARCSHTLQAMVTQKSQVNKDHLHFLWAFSSSPPPVGGRYSERKEINVKGTFAKCLKKSPKPTVGCYLTSCYLALRKVAFFSWPPSSPRSSSSLQEVGHWLISLLWWFTRK